MLRKEETKNVDVRDGAETELSGGDTSSAARSSGMESISSLAWGVFQKSMWCAATALAGSGAVTPSDRSVTTSRCWNVRMARSTLPLACGVGAMRWAMPNARHIRPNWDLKSSPSAPNKLNPSVGVEDFGEAVAEEGLFEHGEVFKQRLPFAYAAGHDLAHGVVDG